MFDRFTKMAATTVLALGVAGGASAQGLGSYDGPYAGLFLGYGQMDRSAGNVEEDSMGFDLGGYVGYEFRQERMYYAGELELAISDKEDNTVSPGLAAFLQGRVGYFLSDGTLVYGLLGIGSTQFEANNGTGDHDVLGYRIGAGAEFRATDDISVRTELAYTMYEKEELGTNVEQDIDDLSLRVGGVYRFQL